MALVVFVSCANSHPFQERRVALTEPHKIGRSVAQARPSTANAVFDCKVLSRNHALVWYDNGKFYLQDTKSSNGTFVNSARLSKGSEESEPKEIFSGDTVQFGVDVMENSRKVTHSCIIATIQLFHPDGREALSSHSNGLNSVISSAGHSLQAQELYQLAQYLQDALHREQMLESKLMTLQRLVQSTQESSENSWQTLIDEDRLLSKLEVLENQLNAYAKGQTDDSLRQELVALHEDKFNYETTAKESLRKVLEEKLEAIRRISELEISPARFSDTDLKLQHSLGNTELECSHQQAACQSAEKELQQLAEKFEEQGSEVKDLVEKLQELEQKRRETENEMEKERQELQNRLHELSHVQDTLLAKIEALQADNDFTTEQLNNTKVKLDTMKKLSAGDSPKILIGCNKACQADLINLLDLQNLIGEKSDDESEELDEEGGVQSHKYEWEENDSSSSSPQILIGRLRGLTDDQGTNDTTECWKDESLEQSDCLLQNSSSNHKQSSDHVINNISTNNTKARVDKGVTALRQTIDRLNADVDRLKEQLQAAKQAANSANDEREQLRVQVRSLQEDIEYERLRGGEGGASRVSMSMTTLTTPHPELSSTFPSPDTPDNRTTTAPPLSGSSQPLGGCETEGEQSGEIGNDGSDINSMQQEIVKESARNRAEFSVLKSECSQLRQRVHDIETEMKLSRLENIDLKEEYRRLQESYIALEQLKTELQSSESTWQHNTTDAQKEAERTRLELSRVNDELTELKLKYAERLKELEQLKLSTSETATLGDLVTGDISASSRGRGEAEGERSEVEEEEEVGEVEDLSTLAYRCRTAQKTSRHRK